MQTKLAKRATHPHVVPAELAQSLSHPNILVTDEVYQDFQNFVHDQQQDDDVESSFGLSASETSDRVYCGNPRKPRGLYHQQRRSRRTA